MADQAQKPSKPAGKPGEKKTETVHLSAEELRKISGGAKNITPTPSPDTKPVKKITIP
jgi:hypothetical protein